VKKRATQIVLTAMIASLLILTGCAVQPEKMHTKDLFALNTFLSFRVYGGANAEQALDSAINRIHDIESMMSITVEDSDVVQINNNSGIRPVKVHEDTFYVIKTALYYSALTEGRFDITIYPIARLWGIGTENARVPSIEEIQQKLPLVNYQNVVLDEENRTVFLEKKGMGIDLGGIAKGFAADEAARIFKEAGIKHAIINMGGSITTIGSRPDDSTWRIGVRNPRGQNGDLEHMAIIESKNIWYSLQEPNQQGSSVYPDISILSAGDYERYIVDVYTQTGVRYHHIFDPFTGYPAVAGVIASTVVSRSAIVADALSTAMVVMGAKAGISLIEGIEGVEGLVITDDKKVYITQGLTDNIEFTDQSFSVMP